MKRSTLPAIIGSMLVAFSCTNLSKTEEAWKQCAEIEKQIIAPAFPEKVFTITEFGAKPDDSLFLNTESLQKAIDECSKQGGGKVVVPAGVYYTGPITLKNNVNLHLNEGSILKFSTDTTLYKEVVLTRWEGVDCYNIRPLIYAYQATNIAVTGKGAIDGQGSKEHWWWMKGPIGKDHANDIDDPYRFGWQEGMPSQVTEGRLKLLNFEQNNVPVDERVLTTNDLLRPQLINFYDCKNILLDSLLLTNSPFWVIHPVFCENMIVRNLTIKSHGPNSDGCDPESSKNILIENCYFDTGDDCIAIKSGRNNDGRKETNRPSENIIVRNCKMKDGHGGVVIGSEISGGFKNLFVENCEMDSPNLDRAIRIKTNDCRGGVIENLFVRNIEVKKCREAVMRINLQYETKEDCKRDFPPTVQCVYLENIKSFNSEYGILINGLADSSLVNTIQIIDCAFDGVAKGNDITGAKDVVFENTFINGEKVVN